MEFTHKRTIQITALLLLLLALTQAVFTALFTAAELAFQDSMPGDLKQQFLPC